MGRAKYRDYMQQHHIAGVYRSFVDAEKRAKQLEGKFFEVKVKKGTKGAARGKPREVWRVWVK